MHASIRWARCSAAGCCPTQLNRAKRPVRPDLQVSLDPVNPAIAPYPPPFNRQLEDAYQSCKPGDPETERCALGANFFNSTIFFRKEGGVSGVGTKSRMCMAQHVSVGWCVSSVCVFVHHLTQRLAAGPGQALPDHGQRTNTPSLLMYT